MLFKLHPDTPKFQVFVLLNQELIYFLNKSIKQQRFGRHLFSYTDVGKACWENSKANDPTAENELTCDKFRNLFECLKIESLTVRQNLYQVMILNQDFEAFFASPTPNLLSFLSKASLKAFKKLATHLYTATKGLRPIINTAGGVDINNHFETFRIKTINGNVCKACGMSELAPIRSNIENSKQWRSDYDHQLCKADYPLFSVHPNNLIPLCDVCNKKAKGDDNIFLKNNTLRHIFYPFFEAASGYINLAILNLRDPEPFVKVSWNTTNISIVNKLDTWDDVYEIKNRAEGHFINIDQIIENEIDPTGFDDFQQQVLRRTRAISESTLKSKPWAYWYQKFFCELNSSDKDAFWERSKFVQSMAMDGGDYILSEQASEVDQEI